MPATPKLAFSHHGVGEGRSCEHTAGASPHHHPSLRSETACTTILTMFPTKVAIRPTDSQQKSKLRVLPKPSLVGSGGPLLGGLEVGGKGLPPGPRRFDREVTDWLLGEEMMLCATKADRNTTSSTNGYEYWT